MNENMGNCGRKGLNSSERTVGELPLVIDELNSVNTIDKKEYSEKTIGAIEEAKAISKDPKIKSYSNMDDLKAALEN